MCPCLLVLVAEREAVWSPLRLPFSAAARRYCRGKRGARELAAALLLECRSRRHYPSFTSYEHSCRLQSDTIRDRGGTVLAISVYACCAAALIAPAQRAF